MEYHAPMPAQIDIQLLNGPVKAIDFDPFPQPAGAECIFLGKTRTETHPEHGDLVLLNYEAHETMALNVLNIIANRAVEKFDCLAVRVHHAVGDVSPCDASVVIQVVTRHRDKSFQACKYLIDKLKVQAPIWKREQWADGTTWSEGSQIDTSEAKS